MDTYDFNIVAGTSFLVYLNVTNSDGTYINLSGYNARGYVKNEYAYTGYIFNLNPLPTEPRESGLIMISGGALETKYLPIGSFNYDIEIYNSGDYALQVLNGDFNIYPSTSYTADNYTPGNNQPINTGGNQPVYTSGNQILIGSGSPEGVVAATSGYIYIDWYDKTLYMKVSGESVNGWV